MLCLCLFLLKSTQVPTDTQQPLLQQTYSPCAFTPIKHPPPSHSGGCLGILNYEVNLRRLGNAIALWLGIQPPDLFFYAVRSGWAPFISCLSTVMRFFRCMSGLLRPPELFSYAVHGVRPALAVQPAREWAWLARM